MMHICNTGVFVLPGWGWECNTVIKHYGAHQLSHSTSPGYLYAMDLATKL
jgi:hypothetical protein